MNLLFSLSAEQRGTHNSPRALPFGRALTTDYALKLVLTSQD